MTWKLLLLSTCLIIAQRPPSDVVLPVEASMMSTIGDQIGGRPWQILKWEPIVVAKRPLQHQEEEGLLCHLNLCDWAWSMLPWGMIICYMLYAKKVAKTNEGDIAFKVRGRFCILDWFQFVFVWSNALWSQIESEVTNFLVAKNTFFIIDFSPLSSDLSTTITQCAGHEFLYECGGHVDNATSNTFYCFSMSRWNDVGQPSSPMGLVIHSNCPLPGIVKAVRWASFGCMGICKNPKVQYIVVLFHWVFVHV